MQLTQLHRRVCSDWHQQLVLTIFAALPPLLEICWNFNHRYNAFTVVFKIVEVAAVNIYILLVCYDELFLLELYTFSIGLAQQESKIR